MLDPTLTLRRLADATAGRGWWVAAGALLILGGAAAGLPMSGWSADFWHAANGAELLHHGLAAAPAYLAHGSDPMDLRSWLLDLPVAMIFQVGGPAALAIAGGCLGALLGLLLLLAARISGLIHPLALTLMAASGALALAPVLDNLPAEILAILSAGLLLVLAALRQGHSWASPALLLLVVAWANLQSDAGLVVLLVWVALLLARSDHRRGQGAADLSWWLLPATMLALFINPAGPWILTHLGLSLGPQNEQPLLALWSVIDFHPWQARFAELAGVLLLFSYWVAARRLLRQDAWLGIATAAMALLWNVYLPLFLVVAIVQGAHYLSLWLLPGASESALVPDRDQAEGLPLVRRLWLLALVPILAAVGCLAVGAGLELRAGGPAARVASQLPVAAASWLSRGDQPQIWYTTPNFGDYLAASFPAGHHLLCLDDPLPLAGAQLGRCEQLAVLNSGALEVLQRTGAKLAVLPRSAPQVAFLLAEGWQIRYRDSETVILGAPHRIL